MFEVIRECSWKRWSAKPGDTVKPGDVPAEVLAVLKQNKAIREVTPGPVKVEAVPSTPIQS